MKIVIPGTPVPQARARITRFGNYNPKYSEQRKLSAYLQALVYNESEYPLNGPLSLEIAFFLPIPKSTSKKQRALLSDESHPHYCRPDLSNYLKQAEDAMNGICYNDDAQIALVRAFKFYSPKPRTEIVLKNIQQD